ncbi:hypothetical protein [Priestia flexa]|uniref:hypothetical protein n=1 Tax=Priestia flexa TaxID=86664 RepID=UPI000B30738E|nr:hypothetical protein [Priestia flexa]
MDEILAVEKIKRAQHELQLALSLIKKGKFRDSIKHLDEAKDSSISSIHLIYAELEGGE